MNKTNLKITALLFSILFLGFFISQINLQEVLLQLQQIGWKFGILLLITGSAYVMASAAWLLCFETIPPQLSVPKLFVYRLIGESLTTINPTNIIAGESAKVYLLNKAGVAYEQGIISILLSRILIFLSMISLFLVLPFALYRLGFIEHLSWSWGIGLMSMTLGFIGLFYSMIHPKLLLYKGMESINNRLSFFFLEKRLPKILSINQGLCDYYRHQKLQLYLAFFLSLLHWIMGAVEIYAIFFLLDIKLSLLSALLIEVGVTFIKSIGGFIPGQIGVEEYGNKLMLGFLGMSNGNVWLTLSILRRSRQLIWLGIGGLFFLGLNLKKHEHTIHLP